LAFSNVSTQIVPMTDAQNSLQENKHLAEEQKNARKKLDRKNLGASQNGYIRQCFGNFCGYACACGCLIKEQAKKKMRKFFGEMRPAFAMMLSMNEAMLQKGKYLSFVSMPSAKKRI